MICNGDVELKVNEFKRECYHAKLYDRYYVSDVSSLCVNEVTYIVPWILENINPNNIKPIFYLHSFGTMEKLRHKGYGRKLLQLTKEYFAGCIMFLDVSSSGEMSNKELIEFYKSEGFKPIYPKDGYSMFQTMLIEL